MLRLSRSKVIGEIEYIIDRPVVSLGSHRWQTSGVECAEERHAYHGQSYSFDLVILRIASTGSARTKWELMLFTEHWRTGDGRNLHSSKWLKLVRGNAADVRKWISDNREIGLRKSAAGAGTSPQRLED